MVADPALLLLAPWLWHQGRRVRRIVPSLPEPPGERAGALGRGPRLRLLILGDSAAAGVGADDQQQALSGRLASRLAARFAVEWTLRARRGVAAAELLADLEHEAARPFDVALISVGVNDVTGLTSPRVFRKRIERIVAELLGRFGVRLVLLSAVPPMHRFTALPQPLRWALGRQARRLDRELAGASRGMARCRHLRAELPDAPRALALDGFHPGPEAFAAWAAAAAAAIEADFSEAAHARPARHPG